MQRYAGFSSSEKNKKFSYFNFPFFNYFFRYYLLQELSKCGSFTRKNDLWTSLVIMTHVMKGKIEAQNLTSSLSHLENDPIYIGYLIIFGEFREARKLLHEMKEPLPIPMKQTMLFIFEREQNLKLMKMFCRFLPGVFDEGVFPQIFHEFNPKSYLTKCFLLFKCCQSPSAQLTIIEGLRSELKQFPHILHEFVEFVHNSAVLEGIATIAMNMKLNNCLYILIPYLRANLTLVAAILTYLIEDDDFDGSEMGDFIKSTFNKCNHHLLLIPFQSSIRRGNEEAFSMLKDYFGKNSLPWITTNPFASFQSQIIKRQFVQSSSETSMLIIYKCIRSNIEEMIDILNLIRLPKKYQRLLLVVSEMKGYTKETEFLRQSLNISHCNADLNWSISNPIARITPILQLTVGLYLAFLSDSIQAMQTLASIKDPFILAAIAATSIERSYNDLFFATRNEIPQSDHDLLAIALEHSFATDNNVIIETLTKKLSPDNPSILIGFFSNIESISYTIHYYVVTLLKEASSPSWKLLYLLIVDYLDVLGVENMNRIVELVDILPVEYKQILSVYAEYKRNNELKVFLAASMTRVI